VTINIYIVCMRVRWNDACGMVSEQLLCMSFCHSDPEKSNPENFYVAIQELEMFNFIISMLLSALALPFLCSLLGQKKGLVVNFIVWHNPVAKGVGGKRERFHSRNCSINGDYNFYS
jgi:hypothetical protein